MFFEPGAYFGSFGEGGGCFDIVLSLVSWAMQVFRFTAVGFNGFRAWESEILQANRAVRWRMSGACFLLGLGRWGL